MFCTKCGAHNADDAKYCYSCGAELGIPAMPPPPPPLPVETMAVPPVSAPQTVFYAGFWRRFLAHVVDHLILSIPSWLLIMLFGFQAFSLMNFDGDMADFDIESLGTIIIGAIWVSILVYVVQLLYYTLFESSHLQATPGKMAIGIVVTDMQGRRISFGRALGRNLGKILSGLILSLGYIMAGLSAKKQALHDMMADCLVVMRPFGK